MIFYLARLVARAGRAQRTVVACAPDGDQSHPRPAPRASSPREGASNGAERRFHEFEASF